MKLLKNVELWCVQADVCIWNETLGEYTEPAYLTIDTETKDKKGNPVNLLIFEPTITDNLRVFDTKEKAKDYMSTRLKCCTSIDGARVVKITWDCKMNHWIRTL